MAMREVSEEEYTVLTRAKNLLDRVWNDPEDGLNFKKKVKNLIPNAIIPEVEAANQTALEKRFAKEAEERAAIAGRLDKWESARKDEKEEGELSKTLNKVKSDFRFTDEGMDLVVSRMKEKNNPDAEAAAAWVLAQDKKNAPISKSNYSPASMNLFGAGKEDAMWADLNKDPVAFFDAKTAEILNGFADAA